MPGDRVDVIDLVDDGDAPADSVAVFERVVDADDAAEIVGHRDGAAACSAIARARRPATSGNGRGAVPSEPNGAEGGAPSFAPPPAPSPERRDAAAPLLVPRRPDSPPLSLRRAGTDADPPPPTQPHRDALGGITATHNTSNARIPQTRRRKGENKTRPRLPTSRTMAGATSGPDER